MATASACSVLKRGRGTLGNAAEHEGDWSLMPREKKPEVEVHDVSKLRGRLKVIGGSMSDDWNNILANQTIRTLWFFENSDAEEIRRQRHAAVDALVGIKPGDELEGMIAAQLIAAHNAAMECYRRAMIGEQTFEGRRDNLAQANKLSRTYATLVEALNRHCGKGQQKVTVEHVHVHAGGQAVVGVIAPPGGRGSIKIKGSTPCKANFPCTSAPDAERGPGVGAHANRRRCQTAAAGCTAERHRAHRREIRTPSSTGVIRQTPLLGAEPSQC
jgi:hypothetical protein